MRVNGISPFLMPVIEDKIINHLVSKYILVKVILLKKDFVELAAARLTAPGIGRKGGSMLNQTRVILQGIFMAPSIVMEAVKGAPNVVIHLYNSTSTLQRDVVFGFEDTKYPQVVEGVICQILMLLLRNMGRCIY